MFSSGSKDNEYLEKEVIKGLFIGYKFDERGDSRIKKARFF
jgi:hypothetical protein